MQTLASDKFEGRLTGSPGEKLAADYLISELKRMGAKPLPGMTDFRMPFTFTAGSKDGGSTFAYKDETHGQRQLSAAAAPAFSRCRSPTAARCPGNVVFAGYGLVVPNSQDFGYDSYQGLDVKDKIVVVLRYFPEDADQKTRAILARYADLRYKAQAARQRGAKGMIVVTGPRSPNAGNVVPMSFDTAIAGSGLVAISVSGDTAAPIFKAANKQLEAVQKELDGGNPHVAGFADPEPAGDARREDHPRAADRQQRRRVPAGDDGDDGRDEAVGRGRRALRSPRPRRRGQLARRQGSD